MAFHVEIFNFKTIKHASATIDGYTLLVGKNFIGKSAFLMAIRAAFENADGDEFIRHGEKFAEVRISFGSSIVIWHKEKGNNFYEIVHNGVTYERDKVGRGGIPEPIHDMGFAPLTIAKEKTLLWYAPQMEVLFLVNRTRQNFTTDLIASIAKLDAIYLAADKAKKNLASAKSSVKVRQGDLKIAREQAKVFLPLTRYAEGEQTLLELTRAYSEKDDILRNLQDISNTFQEGLSEAQHLLPVSRLSLIDLSGIIPKVQMIRDLTLLDNDFRDASRLVEMYSVVTSTPYTAPELIRLVEGRLSVLEQIKAISREFDFYATAARQLLPVQKIDSQALTQKLSEVQQAMESIQQAEAISSLYCSCASDIDRCSKVLGLTDIGELLQGFRDSFNRTSQAIEIHREFTAADKAVQKLSIVETLPGVTLDNQQTSISALSELMNIERAYSLALSEVEELTKVYTEITNQEQELTKELAQFGPCPTCGALACIH